MKKPVRYTLYGIIGLICIVAIFVGVIAVEFKDEGSSNNNKVNLGDNSIVLAETQDKETLLSLFENEFYASNFDDSKIKKIDSSKPLVYNAVQLKENKNDKYEINLNIPIININSELAMKCNQFTQKLFVEKAKEVIENSDNEDYKFSVCNISFTSYVNNNILSVAIKEEIKEGDSKQRVVLQTYNINLETNQLVTIADILQERGLDIDVVQKKIDAMVKQMIEDAETIKASGYEVYNRNADDLIYKVENTSIFMQGPNGELYIIYPYGNITETSAIDVLKI